MKNICLYEPKIEDYWYEEKILSDSSTMNYNSGYNVSYFGYHYDTGCIDFPKDKWNDKFDLRSSKKCYFAYIKDLDLDCFVGFVNYQFVENKNRYECGIVVESKYRGMGYSKIALNLLCNVAFLNGINELYDCFELDRDNTLDIFKAVGFDVVEYDNWKRFDKDVSGVVVRRKLV